MYDFLNGINEFQAQTERMYEQVCLLASERNGKVKNEKKIREIAQTILMRCNSETRFPYFCDMSTKLPPKVYWELLANAYIGSDNLYNYKRKIRKCFAAKHPFKEYLMSEEERTFVGELPDEVTIYRGMTLKEYVSGKYGISWTLNHDMAVFYRDKYMRNYSTATEPKTLTELRIKKSQIVAYFSDRDESEIIYLG